MLGLSMVALSKLLQDRIPQSVLSPLVSLPTFSSSETAALESLRGASSSQTEKRTSDGQLEERRQSFSMVGIGKCKKEFFTSKWALLRAGTTMYGILLREMPLRKIEQRFGSRLYAAGAISTRRRLRFQPLTATVLNNEKKTL